MESLEPLLPYIFGNGGALGFAIWTILDKKKQITEMRKEHMTEMRDMSQLHNSEIMRMLNEVKAIREESRHDNLRSMESNRALLEKNTIAFSRMANTLASLEKAIDKIT